MNDSEFVFVYSTFPDDAAARRVGEMLVMERLAACVNIYPAMQSLYEWDGKLERSTEVSAFIKTLRSRVDDVLEAARAIHPYATPCFLVLPISSGNADYLSWARQQCGGRPR